MLQANQFTPVTFEVVTVGFKLTKSIGRLAAHLLKAHGDLIDDELGLQVPKRSTPWGELELVLRERGILTVTHNWARFEGSFSQDVGLTSAWTHEPVQWAVDLLLSIMEFQKSRVMALNFEVTWLLSGHSSTAGLVAYLGLSHSFGGLYASSQDFEIRGDTDAELPDLFPVRCEVFAGRLSDLADEESVGVQIKHRSPDNRLDPDAPVNFTRATVDQFFALSPQLMERQLAQYFPTRGGT